MNARRATVQFDFSGCSALVTGATSNLGLAFARALASAGAAVGVVGRNGDGKTTLLGVLTGTREPDSGRVTHTSRLSVGYLRQDPKFEPHETLFDCAEGAFAKLHRLHQQLRAVFEAMATAKGAELERLMNRQELVLISQGRDFHILQIHARQSAAMARGALSSRRINENMPHGLGIGRKEMSAPGKSPWLVPGQAQPSLVNQGRGLEGVTRSLPSHFVRGQFPQFLINQRK